MKDTILSLGGIEVNERNDACGCCDRRPDRENCTIIEVDVKCLLLTLLCEHFSNNSNAEQL
jgi:hypothetical protein